MATRLGSDLCVIFPPNWEGTRKIPLWQLFLACVSSWTSRNVETSSTKVPPTANGTTRDAKKPSGFGTQPEMLAGKERGDLKLEQLMSSGCGFCWHSCLDMMFAKTIKIGKKL